MLFQQSWRSSHIRWALVSCFSFTLRSNSSQTFSNGLRSGDCAGQVIWFITFHLGQIALYQHGGVLGHCPVEKQMIVPLSTNQMGWCIAAECCGGHAGSVCLEFSKSQTVSPAKHPHTIPPPPPCFTVGTTHAEIIRSPTLCLKNTCRLEPKISHLDWSD